MNCLDARREILADPDRPSAELAEHLSGCEGCAAAAEGARELDERLREAFEVRVPEGLADRLLLAQTTNVRGRLRPTWFAVAATLVIAVTTGIGWQLGLRPVSEARALERYVVSHIEHEPEALTATERVPREAIAAVLADYDLELAGTMDDIVFLMRCPTPNGEGLHFVVRTDAGPVTVIYMPRQELGERVAIEADGMSGFVRRFRDGSVALVGAPGQSLEEINQLLDRTIVPGRG